jgi:hypothetical protein
VPDFNFAPIGERLTRTRKHIDDLLRSYNHFAPNLDRNRVVVEQENERHQAAKVYFDWEIPPWWGVAIGEAVHHLRSALDNMVWQLVIANGAVPGDKHEFPIAKDWGWFQKVALTKLAGVGKDAFTAIERAQPYNRSDGKPITNHFLWSVNELDIVDKHHVIHVAAVIPEGNEWRWDQAHLDAGGKVTMILSPLSQGTPVMDFVFKEPCLHKVYVKSPMTLQVKIAETERTPYFDFPTWLPAVHDAVVRVIGNVTGVPTEPLSRGSS